MMNHRHKSSRRLPDRHTSYEVGYGKPPAGTRFKPGRSGNPPGRPKGSGERRLASDDRLGNLLLEEAYRIIRVQEPNGPLDIPIAQAIVRSLMVSAARGEHRAQRLVTALLSEVERNRQIERENKESQEPPISRIERVIIHPDHKEDL